MLKMKWKVGITIIAIALTFLFNSVLPACAGDSFDTAEMIEKGVHEISMDSQTEPVKYYQIWFSEPGNEVIISYYVRKTHCWNIDVYDPNKEKIWSVSRSYYGEGRDERSFISDRGWYYIRLENEVCIRLNMTLSIETNPPNPDKFKVSGLSIVPETAYDGENIAISLDIQNSGQLSDACMAELIIDRVTKDTKDVVIDGDETERITFNIVAGEEGTHNVEVSVSPIWSLSSTKVSGAYTVMHTPTPAKFEVRNIMIAPKKVKIGDTVEITVDVANVGEIEGMYKVKLNVDDRVEDSKTVTLSGGETKSIAFAITKDYVGSYNVDVAGLSGTFEVVSPPSTPTPTPTPTPTHITISVTPDTLNISESVKVSGEIVPASSTIVTMIFKSPTGEIAEQPVMSTLSGSYSLTFPPNEVGEWNVNASCVIGGKAIKSETMCFTVKQYRIEVGYAILIVGRNDEWLSQDYIDLTANMTYDTLLKRGFTDERIFYLSPMNFERVDMQTSKENISYAINTWAEEKVGAEVPLFIYIIDHGKEDMLLLKGLGETLSSSELDSNLDELSADTGCYKITVVIESCSSGSFISNLSAAGRIIVTSTGAKANSLIEQTGATFSKYFFNSIAKGKNIKEAFEETSNVPEIKAYSDTLDKVGLSPQISLLDDNGDGIGHPAPVYHGDGSLSSSTYIGSQFGALDFPPTILDSIDNQTVMVGEEIELWAVVVDDLKVERVYATMMEPDFAIGQISNDTMYEINLTTLELKEEVGNRYMVSFVPKKEGRYTFIIHANDEEGNIAKPREVTIVATESEFDTGPKTYLSIIVYNTWIPIVRLEQ